MNTSNVTMAEMALAQWQLIHSQDHLHEFNTLCCAYVPSSQGALDGHQCKLKGQPVLPSILAFTFFHPPALIMATKASFWSHFQFR